MTFRYMVRTKAGQLLFTEATSIEDALAQLKLESSQVKRHMPVKWIDRPKMSDEAKAKLKELTEQRRALRRVRPKAEGRGKKEFDMDTEKKVVASGLPGFFAFTYKGTVHTMAGNDRQGWSLNGAKTSTLNDAMLGVAKDTADTDELDKWSPVSFFRRRNIRKASDSGDLKAVVASFVKPEKAAPKKSEKKKAAAPKIEKKSKSKKVAKKAKPAKKPDLKFSKEKQIAKSEAA